MLKANYIPYNLLFRQAAGTSRGVLRSKVSWFIFLYDSEYPEITGIGECSLIPGLSPDPAKSIETELAALCQQIQHYESWITKRGSLFPALHFGLETALLDLKQGGRRIFFINDFTFGLKPITINGLIWMGTPENMRKQIASKIDAGFNCIKIKVGAIDFEEELKLLHFLRQEFSSQEVVIRLDANGAFGPDEALEKLKQLSAFGIHSIEQPMRQGQFEKMALLCEKSPIPIALDEELIYVTGRPERELLLKTVKPQYIILKPSLVGGLKESEEWISLADENGIDWWVTSALESNIGLNVIAQWTSTKKLTLPQGLGTGQLYTNNFDSPLQICNGMLFHNPDLGWNFNQLKP